MVADESAPPLRADAAANRLKIIEAATAVFAEHGPTAEIAMIADRAGVGVGTLYRHFKNRDDLLTFTARQAMADFDEVVGEFDLADGSRETFRAFVHAIIEVIQRHGWVFDALMGGQLPAHVRETLEAEHGSDNLLLAAIDRRMRQDTLRSDIPSEFLTLALIGPVMAWWYASNGKWPDAEAWKLSTEEVADVLTRLFLDGARPAS